MWQQQPSIWQVRVISSKLHLAMPLSACARTPCTTYHILFQAVVYDRQPYKLSILSFFTWFLWNTRNVECQIKAKFKSDVSSESVTGNTSEHLKTVTVQICSYHHFPQLLLQSLVFLFCKLLCISLQKSSGWIPNIPNRPNPASFLTSC